VQRDDDRPEAVRVRMRAYEECPRPLTDYYGRDRRLVTVGAAGAPEEALARSLRALREVASRSLSRSGSG